MSIIQIEKLTLKFKKATSYVIDGLSMVIESPRLVVIFGNNGSGKTTLLKAILRIHPRDTFDVQEGRISINDPDSIVYLSQSPTSQILTFRVKDEIAVPLSFRGIGKNERALFVEDRAQKFKLTDILENDPSKISSGQVQTVLIASSSAGKPEIVLMDEPTSNLDKPNLTNFLRVIAELKRQSIVIVTTQRPWLFKEYSDLSYKLLGGKLYPAEIPNYTKSSLTKILGGKTYKITTGYTEIQTTYTVKLSSEVPNVIIGPNGSGKTLILLSINGSVDMGSSDLSGLRTKSLYLPADPVDFFSQTTIAEEWKLYCDTDLPEEFIHMEDRSPFTLSSGEMKYLALSILFHSDIEYLLLDEPSSNLDTDNTTKLINYISNVEKFLIIATNDQFFLDELAINGITCCVTELK